jgi:hypothetical protein
MEIRIWIGIKAMLIHNTVQEDGWMLKINKK